MTTSVTLPALGESVTEGTVTRWLKQPGEQVQADEPLLEVSTDKVDTEIGSRVRDVARDQSRRGRDGRGGHRARGHRRAQRGRWRCAAAGTEAAEQAPAEQAEQAPTCGQAEQAPAEQAEQAPAEQAEQAAPTATAPRRHVGHAARAGRERDRRDCHALAQAGRGPGADRRAAAGDLHRQGGHRDPSPASGTLLEIKVAEDETVEVGTELAIIGSADGAAQEAPAAQPADTAPATPEDAAAKAETPLAAEAATQAAADAQSEAKAKEDTPSAPPPAAAPPAPPAPPAPGTGGDGSPCHSLVRKLAAEHSVDLATLSGTGVGGRIRKQDVLAAAEQARKAAETAAAAPAAPAAPAAGGRRRRRRRTPSPLRGTTEKMSRMRTVIAKRMVESLQTSAQLTTVVEVDVTAIARLRQKAKAAFEAREGVKLSFLPFFAKAAVEALKAHPKLNATVDMEKNEVTYFDAEHLGVAVDTERGLLVPVIHGAGDLNIAGLARRIADLAERTRANKISPDELSGGTFTLPTPAAGEPSSTPPSSTSRRSRSSVPARWSSDQRS